MTQITEHDLTGPLATGLAIDAAATPYDGLHRKVPEISRVARGGEAYFVASGQASADDATYDVILRDFTAGVDRAVLAEGGDFIRATSGDVFDALVDGNELGLRFTVTGASGTAGATADVAAALIVIHE